MRVKTPRIDPAIEEQLEADRMNLRDRFAIAAVTGLCASGAESAGYIAERAYGIADAMMEVREQ